jgi:hypothetical protein
LKKFVGCVVIVMTAGGTKVVLQRRGVQDSFPGACQVTAHGKVEDFDGGPDGEFFNALLREMSEALGFSLTEYIRFHAPLIEIFHDQIDDKEIVTYGSLIEEQYLKAIRLEWTSGGLDIVPASLFFEDGGVIEITPDKKEEGYPPAIRAMFPDEIMAVKKALKVFNKMM